MTDGYISMDELRGRIRRKPYVDSAKKVGTTICNGTRTVGSGMLVVYRKSKPVVQNLIQSGNNFLTKWERTANSKKGKRMAKNANNFLK